jgi:hypothetical protein
MPPRNVGIRLPSDCLVSQLNGRLSYTDAKTSKLAPRYWSVFWKYEGPTYDYLYIYMASHIPSRKLLVLYTVMVKNPLQSFIPAPQK